jgi:hypothetical protein
MGAALLFEDTRERRSDAVDRGRGKQVYGLTIGKVASVPPELCGGNITQSSCRVRPDPSVVEGRLAHFLRAPMARAQFDDLKLGTAVPRLNRAYPVNTDTH